MHLVPPVSFGCVEILIGFFDEPGLNFFQTRTVVPAKLSQPGANGYNPFFNSDRIRHLFSKAFDDQRDNGKLHVWEHSQKLFPSPSSHNGPFAHVGFQQQPQLAQEPQLMIALASLATCLSWSMKGLPPMMQLMPSWFSGGLPSTARM